MRRQILLMVLLVAAPAPLSTAAEQTLDAAMHHLRAGEDREWAEFALQAEGASLSLNFAAEPRRAPYTLRLRQRDVKQSWRLSVNDRELGALPADENPMTTFWEIPAAALRPGGNRLLIAGTGRPADDVEIGDVRLSGRPRSAVLRQAALNVSVTDADSGRPIAARLSVVDEHQSLMTVGAESSRRLAVRPGVLYTPDGQAEFGLPVGKYTIYAGRGFEYSLDKAEVELAAGERRDLKLSIRRETPLAGYVSCDTHLHTLSFSGHGDASLAERLVTLAGEGLELPIATDHNVQIDYRPALRAAPWPSLFTPVVGNEVTTRVGHFNVFPLDPAGPAIDHRGADWREVFAAIRPGKERVAVLNHPRDIHGGFRPFDPQRHIALTGESLDGWNLEANAMELVNSGALQSDRWRLVNDWFGLLSSGRRITPVGGSDSHDVARSIVGQARTYIRCRDDEPAKIDVAEAVQSLIAGRVLVSFGLAAEIEVNGRYGPGDTAVVAKASELSVRLRVSGPSWSEADEIILFLNGREIRRERLPDEAKRRGGVKYESVWQIPLPQHDGYLVAVATGPGVSGLYWPTAKPYQPDSPSWSPYTLGASGAVYLDADGAAGYSSPRDYAVRLVDEAGGNMETLARRLADFDEATALQAAAVLRQRGELTAALVHQLRAASSPPVRAAVDRYVEALKRSQAGLTSAEAAPAADAPIAIDRDPETLVTRVIIEAQDGKVAWADLLAGLAKAKGYDDNALDDLPRRDGFDLDRRHTRLILALMNVLAEQSGIEFAILRPKAANAEPKLQVTLDRRAMLASKRRFEKMLRLTAIERLAGAKAGRKYGLSWPANDEPADAQEAIVVLHGLGSAPENHASLSADLRRAGLRVGEFAYPGDEPLDDAAKLLSQELKQFRRDHPEVRLRMATLSMGGLVARRALEDVALDPGNVVQLVMVGPPNHGSALAYCGFGLQVWQFLGNSRARTVAERFYDTVEDGLSAAADDLRPDSPFLKELNSRPRNPRIHYALLLGTGARLSQHAVDRLREQVAEAKERHRFVRFIGPKIDRVLAHGDELIHGLGDGVVSVESGKLEGVDDVLTLDFDHLSMGQPPQTEGETKLRAEIVKRLSQPTGDL